MIDDRWQYRIRGDDFGPVPERTLRNLIAEGTIGPADTIRREGERDWQPARSLPPEEPRADPEAMELDALLAGSSSSAAESDPSAIELDAMLAPTVRRSNRQGQAEWYYRNRDGRHGPFDFETLFDHVADGRLMRYDEIRVPGETVWVEAQTIVGLFSDDLPDLEAMVGNAGASAADATPPRKRMIERQFYYRVLNQELGPVDFEDLFELVAEGNLRPDDEVRGADVKQWQRADSLVGLFPEEISERPPTVAVTDPETAVADDSDEDEGEEAEWFVRTAGYESGPVTFGRLIRMAATGQLQRTDSIRLTRLGNWMEAGSMVGLFHEADAPIETAAPEEPEPPISTVPDRPGDGDADDWAAALLSESAPAPSRPVTIDAPPAKPTPPVATTPATTPSWTAPVATPPAPPTKSDAPPPPTPPATPPRRPAFSPPPAAKKSGPALSLPPGLGKQLANPKVLTGVGVALLAVGLFFIPWGSLFGGGADDLIQQLSDIWGQTKSLYDKKAPESEWAALAGQVGPQLQQIAETAKARGAGPANAKLNIAFLLASDYIPKVLAEKSEATPNRIKTVENFFARANEI